jgi:hypothetical protein
MRPSRARDESLQPPKLERTRRKGAFHFRAAMFENRPVTRAASAQLLGCPSR